jgi:Na+-transporting NADH:ubiquinone oxidoreductase subunit A
MNIFQFRGGYKFSIENKPEGLSNLISESKIVALTPPRIAAFKSKVSVKKGEVVKLGQVLFFNKKNTDVKFTSPANGIVKNILYGNKRILKAIEIDLAEDTGPTEFKTGNISDLSMSSVVNNLIDSGIFTQLKVFPGFDFIPSRDYLQSDNNILFLSLFSTEPHMPDAKKLLSDPTYMNLFLCGLKIYTKIYKEIHIFNNEKMTDDSILEFLQNFKECKLHIMEDKYPAENPGLQHFLFKTKKNNKARFQYTYANFFTIIETGYLFTNGSVIQKKYICVSGNNLKNNTNLLVNKGVPIKELAQFAVFNQSANNRYISGGLFTGKKINLSDYLSNDDLSLQIIEEDEERIFLSFLRLGLNNLTLLKTWATGFFPKTIYSVSTSNQGEERACIQCGYCFDICPVQIMPSLLVKASIINNIEKMENMHIHDCIECELCTFICPAKIEIGQHIKNGKDFIKKEG